MSGETKYPAIVVWSDDDQAYLARTPQLEGCIADGATREEALSNLEDVISEWLISAKNQGWKIPAPLTDADLEARPAPKKSLFRKPLKVAV